MCIYIYIICNKLVRTVQGEHTFFIWCVFFGTVLGKTLAPPPQNSGTFFKRLLKPQSQNLDLVRWSFRRFIWTMIFEKWLWFSSFFRFTQRWPVEIFFFNYRWPFPPWSRAASLEAGVESMDAVLTTGNDSTRGGQPMQPCRGWTNAKISSSERERFFTAAFLRHIKGPGHGNPCSFNVFFCSIRGFCWFCQYFFGRFSVWRGNTCFFLLDFCLKVVGMRLNILSSVNKNHLSTWNFCIFIGHAGNCSRFVLIPVAMSFSRSPQGYKCVSSPSNYESMRITAYPPGNDHISPWKVAGMIIFPFHRWDMFFPAMEQNMCLEIRAEDPSVFQWNEPIFPHSFWGYVIFNSTVEISKTSWYRTCTFLFVDVYILSWHTHLGSVKKTCIDPKVEKILICINLKGQNHPHARPSCIGANFCPAPGFWFARRHQCVLVCFSMHFSFISFFKSRKIYWKICHPLMKTSWCTQKSGYLRSWISCNVLRFAGIESPSVYSWRINTINGAVNERITKEVPSPPLQNG